MYVSKYDVSQSARSLLTLIRFVKFSAKTVLMAKFLQNNSSLNDVEYSRITTFFSQFASACKSWNKIDWLDWLFKVVLK